MINQRYRKSLSIASPSEIERTARQLMAAREGFLTTGAVNYAPIVGSFAMHTTRPMILDSWRRCHAMHVNPSQRYAPLAIARETQLHVLHEVNDPLIRSTRSVISHLADFLADSGYVVVLSDAKGCLLDVVGNTEILRRLARIDFVPGGDWSEAAAGTNAIGTALADGHVVQLMAAEHYCDGWQDLTCTAAPIRHPRTNEVVGVLDVTGNYRLIRPFLTNSLAAAALEVEQRLQTLLAATYKKEEYKKFYGVTVDYASDTNSIETNMNNRSSHRLGKKLWETFIEDDTLSRLNQQERRVHEAKRLAAAAAAVSASLDVDMVLKKVAEQAAYLLRLECSIVCMFNETDVEVAMHIWSKQKHLQLEMLRSFETLLEWVEGISLIRERGEPVIIDDVLVSPLLQVALTEQIHIRSIALLPMVTAHGVIGFIAAPRPVPYHWVVEDIQLGLAFAAQSATAIENARLFDILQQHNRRTKVLNAMVQLLSALPDPGQHLDMILKRIAEIMHLDTGIILLLDQSTGAFTLGAHSGLPEGVSLDLQEYPLRSLNEIASLVTVLGESLLTPDVENDGPTVHESLRSVGFCNLMAVSLATGSATLGVLLVGSYTPRRLTEEDLALFSTIGQQLGLSLKNAELLRSTSEMEVLREADRLKSGFLAAVSHDLRSPLTAIRTSVESLLDRGGVQSTQEQEHLLHNIAGQTSRLGQLVDQLLDLSRIEAGVLSLDRDWTELPVLIADTIAKFARLNGGCHIEHYLPMNLPLHYVDPDRLAQVLWNLLENACKYAPPYSPVKVETRWTGNEVLIEIADRGPGIPAGERERIFQRFYRLDRDRRAHTQGTGLGLAICRGIVEAHGGDIWVEDRAGGGSTFHIALPLPKTDTIKLEALEEHEMSMMQTKEGAHAQRDERTNNYGTC